MGFQPGYTILELGEKDILNWYAQEYTWEHQLEPEDTLEKERIQELETFRKTQEALYKEETNQS